MKGVTINIWNEKNTIIISTHTPVKGVTKRLYDDLAVSIDFNSHAREGRDLFYMLKYIYSKYNFNSHAREGRDII